jgi:1-acyl-sn-glycerol-3-phosphate acyltransferase
MRPLRAIRRLAAILALAAGLLPCAFATRVFSFAGARNKAVLWAARLQGFWGRWSLYAMGVQVDVRGEVPKGTYFVCSNHLTYVDIPLLSALFGARFVAKGEIEQWPLFGMLSKSVGTIFVTPRRRAELLRTAEEIDATLELATNVVLFPEGRASRGVRLERFHTALFEGPVRNGLPCLPVVLHYEPLGVDAGAAWTVCWWGGMDLWRHVWRLAGLGGVRARVTIGEPVVGDDRKTLASELHRRMETDFEPLTQEPVPHDLPWPHLTQGGPA